MEKTNNKAKILIILMLIAIIVGTIIIVVKGFNFDLKYDESNKIELYIGKDFEISDIKNITDEVIPNQSVLIQKVEVYEDSVSIISKEITDEQKNNLVNKVNEKYGTEIKADSTEVEVIPHTRGREIFRPYIIPFSIATVIILIYMLIRYYKLGLLKTIFYVIGILLLAQLILLNIIAITRIPIGRLTTSMIIMVYVLTLIGITTNLEKKLLEIVGKKD